MVKSGNALLVTILVVVVALGLFFMVSQTQFGDEETAAESCGIISEVSINAVDALNQGTAVASPTITASVNGATPKAFTTASTDVAPGVEIEFLVVKANFLSETIKFTPQCGSNDVQVEMFATDDATFQIKNSDGNVVTDSVTGGAVNQSSSSVVINMDLKMTTNSDESSGEVIIVIEADNTSEVDSISLSGDGVSNADVPEFYSVNAAGSIVKAFKVSAITDGASKVMSLNIAPESGQTIAGTGFYVTGYSSQWFTDTDGSFVFGVENADGTIKYEDDFDYDFLAI